MCLIDFLSRRQDPFTIVIVNIKILHLTNRPITGIVLDDGLVDFVWGGLLLWGLISVDVRGRMEVGI